MASVNEVTIIGNLGRDPEAVADGKGCRLSIATSESWKDKDTGEKREQTEWHRVTVWNRKGGGGQADACMKYLSKGRQVYVKGKLQTRKYEDKDGVTKYSTEIRADRVQFLGGKSTDATGDDPQLDESQPYDPGGSDDFAF